MLSYYSPKGSSQKLTKGPGLLLKRPAVLDSKKLPAMKNAQAFSKIDVVLVTNFKSGLQWQWTFPRDVRRFIKNHGGDRYPDNLLRITDAPVSKASQPKAIDDGPIRRGYGLCFYHFLAK